MILTRFALFVGVLGWLGSMDLFAQTAVYDAFIRINGINSIDQPDDTIVLPNPQANPYTADIILRDAFGGFLADAFANNGGGVQSANITVDIAGGTSSGTNFSISKPGTTVGVFFFDQSAPVGNGGQIRGGTGNLGSINGNPATDVGGGVVEALLGTFQFTFDPLSTTTISLAASAEGGFFNGVNRDGSTTFIENLDSPVSLINFRTATITAIPEPSSLAVLGLGTVGMVFRRRRS